MDRADLSKNVLRGFTAFDIFLEQHPEFSERVTFIAHLQPSRQDVPEYVEYLEKIEALVAVINHRHGTTDWMPIDLRLRDDFEEAVALYKHFDLLLVNAMWDGMNLVAKEGPLINTRDGMIILSENTGAHEELGDCALSVNPFDVQEQADAIYTALTASPEERARRMERLRQIIAVAQPVRLDRRRSSPTSRASARPPSADGRGRQSGANSLAPVGRSARGGGAGRGARLRRGRRAGVVRALRALAAARLPAASAARPSNGPGVARRAASRCTRRRATAAVGPARPRGVLRHAHVGRQVGGAAADEVRAQRQGRRTQADDQERAARGSPSARARGSALTLSTSS